MVPKKLLLLIYPYEKKFNNCIRKNLDFIRKKKKKKFEENWVYAESGKTLW